MSEHTDHAFYVKCEAQLIAAQAEVERLRDGLRAVGVIVASLSMTDTNSTRADMARIENYIAGVLLRSYTPPAVIYDVPLEVQAGTVLGINPLDIIGGAQ